MTISIWRYSHLALALISGLFLVLASLTGIVLAFEPMQSAVKPYQPKNLAEVSLATTLKALEVEYDEVLTLEVDANGFVLANVVTFSGDSNQIYVHPVTGKQLGVPEVQHPIFKFATNLHRSLFLKSVGRFFVGVVSFLLCFIAITGLFLIVKRQGGWHKLFSKVQKDYLELRYHVVLGRWFLIPIIIIAASGAYLSAERFSLLPNARLTHDITVSSEDGDMGTKPYELDIFKQVFLNEVRSVSFPFSDFPEDHFEIALADKELLVHQYTGQIVSEQPYPFTFLANEFSLALHTGKGSIVWSLVLLLASMALLFFIYSGLVMWRRRVRNGKVARIQNHKDACSHIILVGSETGTTYAFAECLEQALTHAGKTVFVSQLNDYTSYAKAEQLIVLTATYGDGEAPTNARHFAQLLKTNPPHHNIHYSIVGFGSLRYPNYCKFAAELDNMLQAHPKFEPVLPLYKVNNQSTEAFQDWSRKWAVATNTALVLPVFKQKKVSLTSVNLRVVSITDINLDDTFILRLRPLKTPKFCSGDLCGFTPKEDGMMRWYSIAKYQGDILLSIKKHQKGKCSPFLSSLKPGDMVQGNIKKNPHFHVPKKVSELVCIGNGTGIAPFLGMFDENQKNIPASLYWGGRNEESLALYAPYLSASQASGKLVHLRTCFSRVATTKTYVQHVLLQDAEPLAKKLESGAVFLICGSLTMQNEVLDVLEDISQKQLQQPLSEFEQRGQLKMDCY